MDLNQDELRQALKNIGFDITCGGCASLFYTGHKDRCDATCETRNTNPAAEASYPTDEGERTATIDPKEVLADMVRNARPKRGQPINCRCCTNEWVPGDWNFYDLCPTCFEEFDTQKMRGRCPPVPGEVPVVRGVNCFESSSDWIAMKLKSVTV